MVKKKDQKTKEKHKEQPQGKEDSDESANVKRKSKGKKISNNTVQSSPAKPKKEIEKSKTKGTKSKTNGKTLNEQDGDDQQIIDQKKDFLPGQKHQTPDQDDGARAFYHSLFQQNPQSEIAKKYCLEYGLLERVDAIRIQKELSKKK